MTRGAGKDLATVFRGEADAWGRYVVEAVAPRTLERTLLVRVSVTLQALDARVRGRIEALARGRAVRAASRKGRVKRAVVRTH